MTRIDGIKRSISKVKWMRKRMHTKTRRGYQIKKKKAKEIEKVKMKYKTKGEMKTRPIAISRVLRVFSDRRTDQQTDRPTERLIESRARD